MKWAPRRPSDRVSGSEVELGAAAIVDHEKIRCVYAYRSAGVQRLIGAIALVCNIGAAIYAVNNNTLHANVINGLETHGSKIGILGEICIDGKRRKRKIRNRII